MEPRKTNKPGVQKDQDLYGDGLEHRSTRPPSPPTPPDEVLSDPEKLAKWKQYWLDNQSWWSAEMLDEQSGLYSNRPGGRDKNCKE